MIKEIGSEFWDAPLGTGVQSSLFPKNTGFFLSGRNALSFLIEEIQAKQPFHSVLLPSYCCETMIEPFLAHGMTVEFYPVFLNEQNRLVQDLPQKQECDGILMLDYFGYARQTPLPRYDGIVIWDATHSLLSGVPDNADYVFGSLRKWAGILTGGYAWCNSGSFQKQFPVKTNARYVRLRRQAMEEKKSYITGGCRDKHYLSVFAEAEECLETVSHGAAEACDIDRMRRLDVDLIWNRRRENAAQLLRMVSDFALFSELRNSDCPLFVPIRVTNGKRNELRKFLIEHKIYCPVHWPVSSKHRLTERTRVLYDEELSLICDQRYGQADMDRMCTALLHFFEKEKLS